MGMESEESRKGWNSTWDLSLVEVRLDRIV